VQIRKQDATVEIAEVYLSVVPSTLLLQRELCFNVGERLILQVHERLLKSFLIMRKISSYNVPET
jgi:hypothetical protein